MSWSSRHVPFVLAIALAGCAAEESCPAEVLCSPCPRFATIEVTDSRGAAVAGVQVSGGGVAWVCTAGATTVCTTSPHQVLASSLEVAVSAPGYQAATVTLSTMPQGSGNCCPACEVFVVARVRLAAP